MAIDTDVLQGGCGHSPAPARAVTHAAVRFGVVLPVQDEEQLLPAALTAIDRAMGHVSGVSVAFGIAIVLDACTDRSRDMVTDWQRRTSHLGTGAIDIVETDVGNVGKARRVGCEKLLRRWSDTDPRNIWLATTDSDSEVPLDWISSQLAVRGGGGQVWAGAVDVRDWSGRMAGTAERWLAEYDAEALPIHGANFGIEAALYVEAGGFAPLATGEDRDLFARTLALEAVVWHDQRVRVITSSRRDARAPPWLRTCADLLGGAACPDALAILREAGREVIHPGASYGVWAARGDPGGVTATPAPDGWVLTGRKSFCSGSGLVDRALITAEAPDGYRLFDVAVGDVVVERGPGTWAAVGMADSLSETLVFGGRVSEDDALGPPEFYTHRPGFWFGACGVAACWYGGARGLVVGAARRLRAAPSETALMELGKAASGLQAMTDTLSSVAAAIDLDPEDKSGHARSRALAARQVVHGCCEAILMRTAAAAGARPLCHDADQARRAADLYVYLAQHHGGPDAVALGRLTVEGLGWR